MTAPLQGWTVVVTRPEPPDGPLTALLRARGANVERLATVAIAAPEDTEPLDAACATLERFDWLVFTSARAVDPVVSRWPGAPPRVRVATVGPSTSRAVESSGWRVTLEGDGHGAAGLAVALLARGAGPGTRLLVPASDRARPELADRLRAAGCAVEQVVAYRTTTAEQGVPGAGADPGGADAVTFTSPSAVDGWIERVGGLPESLAGRTVLAIGETTRTRLLASGVDPFVPVRPTFESMAERLVELRRGEGRGGPDPRRGTPEG